MDKRPVLLEVDDISIVGELYIPENIAGVKYPSLCICHGIPAHPPTSAEDGYPVLARKFCQAGFVALIFNFRGAGHSGGNLDIQGWVRDLKAVIDYLSSEPMVDAGRFSLMGFSAGAAVSVYHASMDYRVSSLLLCACPAEMKILAKAGSAQSLMEHFRSIGVIRDQGFPPSVEQWVQGFSQVSPLRRIGTISPRPVLILHGDQDDVVEVGQARALYKRAKEPKELVIVKGAGHRLRQDERAMDIALEWLKNRSRL